MISSIPELLRGHLGQPTPFCYWGGPPINVQSLSSLHSCLRRRRRVTTSMPKPFFVALMPDNLHCLWTHRNHVAHARLNCNLLWEGHASRRQMNFYASELRHCRLHQGCLPALLLDELLFLLLWQNAWQKRLGRKGSFGVAIWRRSLLGGEHGGEGAFRVPAVAVGPEDNWSHCVHRKQKVESSYYYPAHFLHHIQLGFCRNGSHWVPVNLV